jgi:ferredoxin-NADP reductase
VRDNPGGFVAPFLLNELQLGDEVETTGPSGNFYYEPLIDGDDLLFLAGGSGITPFMSIIRGSLGRKRPLRISLLYGSRTEDDVIFGQELQALASAHDNFTYRLVISEPRAGYAGLTGLLDADLIREQFAGSGSGFGQDLSGKTVYICGPGAMIDLCLTALDELGVPSYKIRKELYGPPLHVSKEPDWPKEIAPDHIFSVTVENRQVVRVPAGEPLMNSLERYGIVVPAICRTGACSACRIQLLSGNVYMPAHTGLRDSDRQHRFVHACVSYPVEDCQIRV